MIREDSAGFLISSMEIMIDDANKTSEKYPFYGQATDNNGIISYESLKSAVLNNKNALPTILVHSNNQNVVYLQTPFYLKDGHGATSVLQVVIALN